MGDFPVGDQDYVTFWTDFGQAPPNDRGGGPVA